MAPRKRRQAQQGSITTVPPSSSALGDGANPKDPDPYSSALATYILKFSSPSGPGKTPFRGGYVLSGISPFVHVKVDDAHSTDFHIGFCSTTAFRTLCSRTTQADNKDVDLPKSLEREQLNDLAHDLRDLIYEMEHAYRKGEETSELVKSRKGKWELIVACKMIPFGAMQYSGRNNQLALDAWEETGKPKGEASMYAVLHLEMDRGRDREKE